jgi:hypothetical protein
MVVSCGGSGEQGGERSWSWAAVSLSMTAMEPPHWGQSPSGHAGWTREASGSVCGGATAPSSCEQSGSRVARLRLARKPKLRMRTKPLGEQVQQEGAQELVP